MLLFAPLLETLSTVLPKYLKNARFSSPMRFIDVPSKAQHCLDSSGRVYRMKISVALLFFRVWGCFDGCRWVSCSCLIVSQSSRYYTIYKNARVYIVNNSNYIYKTIKPYLTSIYMSSNILIRDNETKI